MPIGAVAAANTRVLVTGSRVFARPGHVQVALTGAGERHPRVPLVLAHGKCDPRYPVTQRRIPWAAAERLRACDQWGLLGADWQAHCAAVNLGWATDPLPADWARYQNAAGPARNDVLVARGAREGHAFLSAGLRNNGTMDCATKMLAARIQVWFWCCECPPEGLASDPCEDHSLRGVKAGWRQVKAKLGQRQLAEGVLWA